MHPPSTNILLINTDQLSAQALSAWGNTYGHTPNIDQIIKRGVRFEQAYTNCPLCQPARASLWTGHLPHRTGILSNGCLHPVPRLSESEPTLGSLFSEAGYKTIHFGKQHDAGSLRGFECYPVERKPIPDADPAWPLDYDSEQDRNTRCQAVDFISTYAEATPYLAIVDLNNPHDICNWVGAFQGDRPVIQPEVELPPLPDNLHLGETEFTKLPLPIQYICCAHNRQAQIAEWDETKIQLYLCAYHHYIQRVDADIGHILTALKNRADAEHTLIVFMADHGDSMGGHWMATKHTSFYDETTRVPLVFAGHGISGRDRAVNGPVSLVDLMPTLCDYAGIPVPPPQDGTSLLPWLQDRPHDRPHDFITCQWHTEWGFTIEPGRMIRSERFKYTHYLECDGEQLYDMHADPGEKRNLAGHPEYTDVLRQHREILRMVVKDTQDPYFSLEWEADPRWRSHAPGYRRHRGVAAPSA